MVSQFLWEGFVSEYRPTVEEFNWVEYDVGGGSALMLQLVYYAFINFFFHFNCNILLLTLVDHGISWPCDISISEREMLLWLELFVLNLTTVENDEIKVITVVFAVDDYNSFDEAKKIIEEIIEERKRKVRILEPWYKINAIYFAIVI
uniref:Uncharacterized protein n=1 Tax=Heterorhabditis bacteriophora TaxID=37862 RepID=A0A1I7W7T3_HETBA